MQKKLLKRTILLFLLVGIVFACIYDDSYWFDEKDLIAEAQKWYAENMDDPGTIQFDVGDLEMLIKPDWEHPFVDSKGEYATVELVMFSNRYFGIIDPECSQKFEETKDSRYLTSKNTVVIRKNLKTKEMDGFIMAITPNLRYLESVNFAPFRSNTYLERDERLNGHVVYYDLNGNFVNGWQYVDGEAFAIEIENGRKDSKFRSSDCYTSLDYSYTETIQTGYIEVYANGSKDFVIALSTRTISVYSTHCDGSGSGGGGYGGGSSGGGYAGNGGGSTSATVTDPCVSGTGGNATNNAMFSNNTIKTKMDDVLRGKLNVINEWSVTVVQNSDGSYGVSNAQEHGPTSGTITPPSGNYVANGHSQGIGSTGVPSIGDLYSFLETVKNKSTFKTMYVYGEGWYGAIEVYAINVYDRIAVRDFLDAYPKSSNWNSFSHGFVSESIVGYDYFKARNMYNTSNRDIHGVTYPYVQDAVALASIMSQYNMGVALSRKVNNGSFEIINAQIKKNESSGVEIIDIITCQ
ncbi:hypothetical protein FACS189451_09140 [Bacteroidia bacterium]|nr:hypothetical protein FACS189451_09140 [Bacteroidia bacterium]